MFQFFSDLSNPRENPIKSHKGSDPMKNHHWCGCLPEVNLTILLHMAGSQDYGGWDRSLEAEMNRWEMRNDSVKCHEAEMNRWEDSWNEDILHEIDWTWMNIYIYVHINVLTEIIYFINVYSLAESIPLVRWALMKQISGLTISFLDKNTHIFYAWS